MAVKKKKILIIAGPNGAGKTTFANEFLPNEADCYTFINADLIASGLSPFQPGIGSRRAGRIMLEEITSHVRRGESFAFETTLSGRTYIQLIRNWQRTGYQIKLYFLSLPDPEDAIARIASRVAQGGHHVPDDVVRRRFLSGLHNFQTVYRFEVNYWHLYDNSGTIPVLIEEGHNT
jgi:predicted ABC-type ATPase